MSVPEISLVTVLLTSVVPAIGAAQTRGAATGRSTRSSAAANRFVAGRLTGTTVRPAPAPARHPDRFLRRVPGYYRTGRLGFSRADLASYERTLVRQYTFTAAARVNDEFGSRDFAAGPADYSDAAYPWESPAPAPGEEAVAHLDWKPGGIFPAGEEPAALATAAAAPRPPVPGVFEAVVPAEGRAGSRLVDVRPVIGWTDVPCVEPAQERQKPSRVPRVLGWLYRWARGFDIEKSNTTPPLLYLRSPLLSGFQEPVGCPHGDEARPAPGARSCYAVTASNGFDHLVTYLVPLPQLGARTPRELTTSLRQRLDKGETVGLKTIGGGVVELTPDEAVSLDVRACEDRTD
jgi:hypothetical protein